MNNILIIQTAFIGDVILATPIIEAIHQQYPNTNIDFLLRKGNESLFKEHPHLNKILIWDKKNKKYKHLFRLLKTIRSQQYDTVVNIQRFGATGLLTLLSKAKIKIGFDNNPFSFGFTHKILHSVDKGFHETERNLQLLKPLFTPGKVLPALFPTANDLTKVKQYQDQPYLCAAPTSVWFTKQYAKQKWIELFNQIKDDKVVYLLGAPSDYDACQAIINESTNKNLVNLAGKLNLLSSAALMKNAVMNFVNDSAPMHLASSVNAPTTAIFCSTIPAFGFGPLSENSEVVEVEDKLECRPCGLHGRKSCPENHFNCAMNIDTKKLLKRI